MTDIEEDQLELLEDNKLSLLEAYKCYEDNKEYLLNTVVNIFTYKQEIYLDFLYLLIEIIYPSLRDQIFPYFCNSHNIKIYDESIEERDNKKKLILSFMAFDDAFYMKALNWCSFLKFEAIDNNVFISKWFEINNFGFENYEVLYQDEDSEDESMGEAATPGGAGKSILIGSSKEIGEYGTLKIEGKTTQSGNRKVTFIIDPSEKAKNEIPVSFVILFKLHNQEKGEFVKISMEEFDGYNPISKTIDLDYQHDFEVFTFVVR